MSSDLLYDPHNHLWLREESDGSIQIGVTRAILAVLGAPSFMRLPEAGKAFSADESLGSLETDKTAFAIALPFAGSVVAAFPPADAAALPAAADGESPVLSVRPSDDGWKATLVDASAYTALSAP